MELPLPGRCPGVGGWPGEVRPCPLYPHAISTLTGKCWEGLSTVNVRDQKSGVFYTFPAMELKAHLTAFQKVSFTPTRRTIVQGRMEKAIL
jgi:hypothetical protein